MRIVRGASVLIGLVMLLISGVMAVARHGQTPPSWIVFTSKQSGNLDLYRISSNGSGLLRLTDATGYDHEARWSPDGDWIVFQSHQDGNYSLFRMRRDGSGLQQITGGPGNEMRPVWSPDGTWILFEWYAMDTPGYYRMRPDGLDQPRLIIGPGVSSDAAWSPDGQWIVYSLSGDLYRVRSNGSDQQQLTHGKGDDLMAAWSPDGAWVVYVSYLNPTHQQLYRMRPDGADQQQFTHNGARNVRPSWSPDGQWVMFHAVWEDRCNLCRIRADGTDEQCYRNVNSCEYSAWSPDGAWIVYGNGQHLVRMRPDGSDRQRLTDNPGSGAQPQWSPPIASHRRAAWDVLIGAVLVIAGTVRWRSRANGA